QGGEPRVVFLGNLEAELFGHRDHEVQVVHRVDVELVAQVNVRLDLRGVGLGRDLQQQAHNRVFQLAHKFSGCSSSRAIARRNRPPRWPSLARWSADRVAITLRRATSWPSITMGRGAMAPKPTMATCGG